MGWDSALPIQHLKNPHTPPQLLTAGPGLQDPHLARVPQHLHLHLKLERARPSPDRQDLSKAVRGAAALGRGVAAVGASRGVARLGEGRGGDGAGVGGCGGGARGARGAEGGL